MPLQPLPDLLNGLKIIEPFLTTKGFQLDNYENGRGERMPFTNAYYINNNKRISIGYSYTIDIVTYQCDTAIVSHGFYLDHSGFAVLRRFPGFPSDDKLLVYRYILHDFNLLTADFFDGSCSKLKELVPLQRKEGEEINKRQREQFENGPDLLIIQEARLLFKSKRYADCIRKYKTVKKRQLLTGFDKKVIVNCETRLV